MALVAVAALAVVALCSALLVTGRDDKPDKELFSASTPIATGPSTSASPESSPSPSPTLEAASPAAFYADSRLALSPLIVHVREIPQSLNALSMPAAGSFTSLATVGETWTSDVATARDLVSRLPVKRGTSSFYARQLYEAGALLYLEATRSIGVAASATNVNARVATAATALRLLQLGDRTFDSAFRLLNQESALSNQEMIFPVTVPDFDATSGAPVYDTTEAQDTSGAWARQHEQVLRALRAQVASPGSSGGVQRIRGQVRALGSSVPADAWEREAAVTLRLAALTVAESLSATSPLTTSLELLGQQLWRIGGDLLTHVRNIAPGFTLSLPPAEQTVVRRTLYTGGVFNGTPPPLRPGENPGAGVPGGLPVLNPLAILGGS